MKKKAVNEYFSRISENLPCSGRKKTKMLSDFRCRVEEFAAQKSNVCLGDICEEFGDPDEIAEYYRENSGMKTESADTAVIPPSSGIFSGIFRSLKPILCVVLVLLSLLTVFFGIIASVAVLERIDNCQLRDSMGGGNYCIIHTVVQNSCEMDDFVFECDSI